jgi:hypothetical protein
MANISNYFSGIRRIVGIPFVEEVFITGEGLFSHALPRVFHFLTCCIVENYYDTSPY